LYGNLFLLVSAESPKYSSLCYGLQLRALECEI